MPPAPVAFPVPVLDPLRMYTTPELKLPDGLVASEYFPWYNASDTLIDLWDMVPPRVSRVKMDLLLWSLHHPLYTKEQLSPGTAQTRRTHVSARLPVQVPTPCPSTHTKTIKVPAIDRGQPAGLKTITKPVTVQYNNIHEMLVRQMSCPLIRKYWLWQPTDRHDDDPIREFVDTPLAKQPRRWSRDGSTFTVDDVEYHVGDYVLLTDYPGYVYCILQTSVVENPDFLNNEAAWPTLEVDLQEFQVIGGREIIQVQTTFCGVTPTDIARKCTVSNDEALPADFWCNRYRHEDGTEIPLTLPTVSLAFDDDGTSSVWFAVFVDGFDDEHGSTCAFYIQFLNIMSIVRGMDMFKLKVMLVPDGVCTHKAAALLRRDIAFLERGFAWWDPIDGVTRNIRARCVLQPADLMQLYTNLRHGGNGCIYNCPNCNATKALRVAKDQNLLDFRNERTGRYQRTNKRVKQSNTNQNKHPLINQSTIQFTDTTRTHAGGRTRVSNRSSLR
jgi:hypothetical protein